MRFPSFRLLLVLSLCLVACGSGAGTAALNAHGVGSLCQSDADCTSPLFCNVDPVGHVVDQQCTEPCDYSQPCTTSLGASACIGASLCVHTCNADSDCPTGTVCNSDYWCQRGDRLPSNSDLRCTGTPLGCAAVKDTDEDCEEAPGCQKVEQCTGDARSCYDQGLSCTELVGCEYDIDLEGCTGTPPACSMNSDDHYCNLTLGCLWDYSCVGTAKPCEALTAAACAYQPGCTLQVVSSP